MENNQTGMTLIVKTVSRLTVGLIFIYGIYIVLQGHLGPGGGVAGGIIIVLSFIHLMLAFGKDAVLNKLNKPRSIVLTSLGAMFFLLFAIFGFLGKHTLKIMLITDMAISVMAGAGLFAIFLALILLIGEKREK